ncbi:hypothetical protein FACS1894124_5760 [Spirochaetia bacterium]|nr:hypothetical protein FACS1894124_5760 [Spirochaetia bacterium]
MAYKPVEIDRINLTITGPETGVLRNLANITNQDVYERYISDTIDGDVKKPAMLIFELSGGAQ